MIPGIEKHWHIYLMLHILHLFVKAWNTEEARILPYNENKMQSKRKIQKKKNKILKASTNVGVQRIEYVSNNERNLGQNSEFYRKMWDLYQPFNGAWPFLWRIDDLLHIKTKQYFNAAFQTRSCYSVSSSPNFMRLKLGKTWEIFL